MKKIRFTLVLAILMLCIKIGYSLTATVTVYWHGGWCTICGTDYSCSTGVWSGTWNGGNNTFSDPLPAGATLTWVSVTTCEADCGATSVPVSIDGSLIGTYNPGNTCLCGQSIFYTVSGCPPPNYVYQGNNTLHLAPNNLLCVSHCVITLTYTMNNPIITASGPLTFCQGGSVTLTAPAGSSYHWSNNVNAQNDVITTSGNYSVTVTNGNGCTAVYGPITVTVTAIANPTITANGPLSFCQGGSVTLSSSNANSYLWNTGAITQSIVVTTSGVYSVTITNASGCTAASSNTTVTVWPPPTATITPSGPLTFCQGGSVTLTSSAGNSYLWSNGANTQSITVTTSGTYTVTVTGAHGCTAVSAPITVTVNALPTPTITPSGPLTFCTGGSVTLTCNPAGTSYLWSDGEVTQSITVITSGTFTVQLTDGNGCIGTSASITVVVNNATIPTITASGPTTFCQGGSVTLTSSIGSSYLWSDGEVTQSITVTTSGIYTVQVTDGNGCVENSAPITITVNALPTPTITASGPINFCNGGSVTLTCTAGSSYLWSDGEVTQSIVVTTSGTYTITMTDANGCVGISASITVTVNPLPTPTITAGGPITFCQGGSVTLTCTAGASYLWSDGEVTQSIVVTTSGTYTVTMTDANGCVGTSASITVTVNPLPTPTITASGPISFCNGGSVTLTSSVGSSYLWSTGAITQSIIITTSGTYTVTITNANGCVGTSAPITITVYALPTPGITAGGPLTFCNGGSVILTCTLGSSYLWSTGAVTQSITVTTSGTYTVTMTDANGCVGTSAPITVTVNPLPVVTITAGGPITFCQGGSVVLTSTAGSSYLWSTGAVTQSITVTTSGTYTVTMTDANGCVGTSAPITVTVNPLPTPTITAGGPITFCQGGSVTLTCTAGSSYLWSTGAVTQSITVTTSGTYTVTLTDANGCVGTSAPITVTVNPLPTPTITAGGPITFCQGGSVTLTCTPGSSYLWSTGAITQSITVNTSGTYTVTMTDANGCVGTSAPITVTVNPLPTPTITAGGPITFCQGGSITLTCTAGSSYLWSTGAVTQSITVNTSGTYTVTMTDANGCVGTSAPITVTVNPLPTPVITAGGATTFCQGGSVTLTCTAGSSYLWSTGAVTQSITVNTSGTYTVTLTDANGCVGTSAGTTVTVNPLPTPTITASGPITFCIGGSVTLTCTAGASYLWSTGAITQSIVVTTSGTYTVTMTDANGCVGTSASITVTVNTALVPTITASGPTTFCQGGSVTLTASAGASYLWSTGAVTQSITVNTAGNYSVNVTDINGCSGNSAVTVVTVNPLPTPVITAGGPTTFCQGGNVTLTCTAGSSYLWSTGAVTQSITVNASGIYTVTMTDANGCVGTSPSITITVNPLPTPTITAGGPITFCQGGNVTLTCNPAGASYLWSTGAVTQGITVNASGTYTVTLTDANGCVGISAGTTITVNPLPTPTITAGGPITFCQGGSVTLTCTAGSSYLWSTGAVTQSITVNTAGTYTVTLTDANGCVGASAGTTVTVNPLPTPTITAGGPLTFCQGGTVTLTCTAGSSYLWSNGAVIQSITVNASGTYSVTMTNASGCIGSSAGTTVVVNPLPTPTITAGGPLTFCQGGTVTLTCNAGSSYLWSTGAVTQSIIVNASGTYTVTLTDANGCVGTSAGTTVTVNPLPTPTITAGGPLTFCQGGSVTLTCTAGSSYLWSTGAVTQSITVSTAGNYTVTLTNANGCVGTSAQTTVVVNPLPTPTITAGGPLTFCQGGSVTLTCTAGSSYLWSTGAVTQAITVNASGTYTVTMTNANGCAGTTAGTTVTVHPLPTPTITVGGSTSFCAGGNAILTCTPAGASYLWSTGAVTQAITVNASGNYTVTLTDANGCIGTSAGTAITVNPLPTPTITAGGPTSFCQGSSVILTCTAGASYVWNTGAATQSITVTNPGTYTVTMTDANGCVGTSPSITVIVNAIPLISLGPDQNLCTNQTSILNAGNPGSTYLWSTGANTQTITINSAGTYWIQVSNGNCSASDTMNAVYNVTPIVNLGPDISLCSGSTAVTLDAGNAGMTYLWSSGENTQTISPTSSGTYWVRVTSNGCSGFDSVKVAIGAPIIFSLGNDTTICPGDQLVIDAGDKQYYNYSWYPGGETTHFIIVHEQGRYVCQVADTNGCIASSIKMVTEFCPSDLYVPSAFAPDGIGGKNTTFMAYCNGAVEFHMYIFDRWGSLVFESTDISTGWDGTISGQQSQQGVYAYRIDYKTYDNVELQKHTKTGTVTLIR